MSNKFAWMAIAASLLLSACTSTVNVDPISVDMPMGTNLLPGKYAVYIQTGGWDLTTESGGFNCSAWSFDTDVNPAYKTAMKEAISRTLSNPIWVDTELDAEALRQYDGEIVIYQQNASSAFQIIPGFFSGTAQSTINLMATVALTKTTGLAYQQAVSGQGTGSVDLIACPDADKAIAQAAQISAKSLVQQAVMYIKDAVRDQLAPPAPTKDSHSKKSAKAP